MREIRINDNGRTCNGQCAEFKDWSQFYEHPSGRNGRGSTCKVCTIEKVKDNYKKRKTSRSTE